MAANFFRRLRALELEEQMLNGGAILAMAGVLMPWVGGYLLGSDSVTHTGLGFYTSFLGLSVLLLNLFILLTTVIPLTGGPVLIKRRHREVVRLCLSAQASILVLAALSVLTKVTFEFSRMEIRFGIYVTLIGSLIVFLYSFLCFQEQRKSKVEDLFHHLAQEQTQKEVEKQPERMAVTPPPAPQPEEHHTLS